MSFIMDSGGRYRRRAAERRQRLFVVVLIISVIAGIAYWWGSETVRSREEAWKQQSVQYQKENTLLQKTVTDLKSELQSARVRYQQLEARYKQEVPTEDLKVLMDSLRKQLKAGARLSRLSSAIMSSRPPKNCTTAKTKRFVLKTPMYAGPDGKVSFGNGAIVISGEGESAVGIEGKAEAWYDPGKPVSIYFTRSTGKRVVRTGLLPIQDSIILGSKEYRFTVAPGKRSFIDVTWDRCDYP